MKRLAAVLVLSLCEIAAAAAARPRSGSGGIPQFDLKALCRRAMPLSAGEKSAFQSCIDDESAAKKELEKLWGTFKASARTTCVQGTMIGGTPSYVELITCLQLDKQAADAARENAKALKMPGGKAVPPPGGGRTPTP
jgi:hypothetical protein